MHRILPGEKIPNVLFHCLEEGETELSSLLESSLLLLLVYRGLQCPLCKNQLLKLDSLSTEFQDREVNILAVSADTRERAIQARWEWDIENFELAYDLDIDVARQLGLYISKARKDSEMPYFTEPGIFLIEPDNSLYAAWIASFPLARPDFADILKVIDFRKENKVPARGAA